ncbi:MAG: hypothetical protein WCK54_20650 [Desulfuromonadales bacterium]
MTVIEIEIYPDGRMDTDNASAYTGDAKKTMAMRRCKGDGPPFVKSGGKIFYFKDDLDRWIAEGAGCKSTAQARQKRK